MASGMATAAAATAPTARVVATTRPTARARPGRPPLRRSRTDDPSEGQLRDALPGVIEKHGLPLTQVMLASVVCGEAVASPIIIRFLKHDEAWKLPPAPTVTTAPVMLEKEDSPEREALKAERKARKAAEQEAARRRREQSAQARRRG